MKEEKYIQSLFEIAHSEEPQLSFEEASKTFEASLTPGIAASIKDWFLNHLKLNAFIMMTTIGIIATIVFLNSQPNEIPQLTTATFEDTPELVEDSIVPVTDTVETQNEIVEISLKAEPDKIKITKTPIVETKSATELTAANIPSDVIDITPPIEIIETVEEIKMPIIEKRVETILPKASRKTEKRPELRRSIPIQKRELSELEIVLETALNLEHLKEDLFARNRRGEYDQLIIQANDKFDHLVDIQFAGKKVIVVPNSHNEGFQIVGGEFVDVQKFKISEKKAFLKFIYNSVIVDVHLMKEDGIWYYKSTSTDHQQDYLVRQELLQHALDHERMQEVIERDKQNEFKPLVLLSNGLFSTMVEVFFDSKELEIVPNKYNRGYDRKIPHAVFSKFQIKRRKATIEFAYKGNYIAVNYRKKNGVWIMKSFSHKSGDSNYLHKNF